MLFKDALDGYWLAKQRDFSQNTVNDYSLTFRRFQQWIGDKHVHQVTTIDVRRFLNYLREDMELSKKTVCNAWVALSSFWTWAEKEIRCEHIIRGHVDRPDFRRPMIEIYTETEIKAMLGACEYTAGWNSTKRKAARTRRPEGLRDQAIIITLVDTGLRASELCNLEIRDYISQQGRLMVRGGKGDKDRVVFLGQSGRRVLWRYLAERPGARQTDPVFATRTGTKIERNNLRKCIQRIADRAGVAHITVHRFRHTFAVTFLRNGGNVLELQELLGHEKLDTIRIYARLAEVDLAAAQRRASPADNWRL